MAVRYIVAPMGVWASIPADRQNPCRRVRSTEKPHPIPEEAVYFDDQIEAVKKAMIESKQLISETHHTGGSWNYQLLIGIRE